MITDTQERSQDFAPGDPWLFLGPIKLGGADRTGARKFTIYFNRRWGLQPDAWRYRENFTIHLVVSRTLLSPEPVVQKRRARRRSKAFNDKILMNGYNFVNRSRQGLVKKYKARFPDCWPQRLDHQQQCSQTLLRCFPNFSLCYEG